MAENENNSIENNYSREDEAIHKILKKKGYLPPQTLEEYEELENEILKKGLVELPERLRDPLKIIDKFSKNKKENFESKSKSEPKHFVKEQLIRKH